MYIAEWPDSCAGAIVSMFRNMNYKKDLSRLKKGSWESDEQFEARRQEWINHNRKKDLENEEYYKVLPRMLSHLENGIRETGAPFAVALLTNQQVDEEVYNIFLGAGWRLAASNVFNYHNSAYVFMKVCEKPRQDEAGPWAIAESLPFVERIDGGKTETQQIPDEYEDQDSDFEHKIEQLSDEMYKKAHARFEKEKEEEKAKKGE